MHVFGLWEEAGILKENPHIHEESVKTPHRKAPTEITIKVKSEKCRLFY